MYVQNLKNVQSIDFYLLSPIYVCCHIFAALIGFIGVTTAMQSRRISLNSKCLRHLGDTVKKNSLESGSPLQSEFDLIRSIPGMIYTV